MEFPFLIRFHNNAQRWKYVISTGNFHLTRICSFFQKPDLSDCERMISVDYIMNALEHSKVWLPFFWYTLYKVKFSDYKAYTASDSLKCCFPPTNSGVISTQPKTPKTFCKLSTLPTCCNLSILSSCNPGWNLCTPRRRSLARGLKILGVVAWDCSPSQVSAQVIKALVAGLISFWSHIYEAER